MTSTVRTLASLLLLMPALALPLQGAAWAQEDETNAIDDTPHITIVGTAHAEVAPDLATITLGVTSEKPSARDASDETARIAQAVIAAARAQGVASADITTQAVTLAQTFDETRDSAGHYGGQKRYYGASATSGVFYAKV